MKNPQISVVMPVYNGEKYLSQAINSILTQSFKDFEFIIIDDNSTDNSLKILNQFAKTDKRIIILRNKENLRATKTLNVGLKKARGQYIARMDADDWSYPNRFQRQFKFMEKHPDIGVSGSTIEICNKDLKVKNLRRYPLDDASARKIIFRYSPFAHPVTFWRKDMLDKVGGYNEAIPLSQDYELYFRIGKICKFGNLPDTLLKLRTHEDSSSIIRGRYQEQFALYTRIKAYLELGYNMTTFDKLYTFLQMISMMVIPPKIKFFLFNILRRII